MTFVFHPLSHYNTFIKPRTHLLLSLIEDLSIDFPSHFILSLIDKDMTTRDKLIFPSAIMRLLRHFSVFYLESSHFTYICAVDVAIIWRSTAQLRLRHPQTHTAALPASMTPSFSAPSSSAGGVTFESIMAQLVRMDALLDTLSDELFHVNTRVSCITWWQAMMGGFTVAYSPSPEASEDESDNGFGSADNVEDDDDGSPSDDEMSTWFTYLVTRDKKGE